jgi:hypothetical protein
VMLPNHAPLHDRLSNGTPAVALSRAGWTSAWGARQGTDHGRRRAGDAPQRSAGSVEDFPQRRGGADGLLRSRVEPGQLPRRPCPARGWTCRSWILGQLQHLRRAAGRHARACPTIRN